MEDPSATTGAASAARPAADAANPSVLPPPQNAPSLNFKFGDRILGSVPLLLLSGMAYFQCRLAHWAANDFVFQEEFSEEMAVFFLLLLNNFHRATADLISYPQRLVWIGYFLDFFKWDFPLLVTKIEEAWPCSQTAAITALAELYRIYPTSMIPDESVLGQLYKRCKDLLTKPWVWGKLTITPEMTLKSVVYEQIAHDALTSGEFTCKGGRITGSGFVFNSIETPHSVHPGLESLIAIPTDKKFFKELIRSGVIGDHTYIAKAVLNTIIANKATMTPKVMKILLEMVDWFWVSTVAISHQWVTVKEIFSHKNERLPVKINNAFAARENLLKSTAFNPFRYKNPPQFPLDGTTMITGTTTDVHAMYFQLTVTRSVVGGGWTSGKEKKAVWIIQQIHPSPKNWKVGIQFKIDIPGHKNQTWKFENHLEIEFESYVNVLILQKAWVEKVGYSYW